MLKLRVKSKRKKRDSGAGIDWVTFVKISEANVLDKPLTPAWKFIDRQSEMVLEFINAHDWNKQDTGAMVRQTLQFWHYFSNMLQMNFR